MWLSWHLTSTRKTPKTSSAAWTWKQPCTGLILCPMMCAVMPWKRCWSECQTFEASWFFYSFCLVSQTVVALLSIETPAAFSSCFTLSIITIVCLTHAVVCSKSTVWSIFYPVQPCDLALVEGPLRYIKDRIVFRLILGAVMSLLVYSVHPKL